MITLFQVQFKQNRKNCIRWFTGRHISTGNDFSPPHGYMCGENGNPLSPFQNDLLELKKHKCRIENEFPFVPNSIKKIKILKQIDVNIRKLNHEENKF